MYVLGHYDLPSPSSPLMICWSHSFCGFCGRRYVPTLSFLPAFVSVDFAFVFPLLNCALVVCEISSSAGKTNQNGDQGAYTWSFSRAFVTYTTCGAAECFPPKIRKTRILTLSEVNIYCPMWRGNATPQTHKKGE